MNADQIMTEEGVQQNQQAVNVLPIEQLQAYFDKKFNEQSEKLESKISADSKRLEKKLRGRKTVDTVELKYRGNKVQYNFNNTLLQSLEDLRLLIEEGSVTRSCKRVDNIISDIQKRNKCIRFADKSPAGWAAVDEYLSDDLASDSDDDKKMKSAENRAISKRKSSKRKISHRQQPYQRPSSTFTSPAQHDGNHPATYYPPPFYAGRPSFSFQPRLQPSYQFQRPSNINRQQSLCFGCGKPGHWRKECPEIKQA